MSYSLGQPGFQAELCDPGLVSWPLWALVSSYIKNGGMNNNCTIAEGMAGKIWGYIMSLAQTLPERNTGACRKVRTAESHSSIPTAPASRSGQLGRTGNRLQIFLNPLPKSSWINYLWQYFPQDVPQNINSNRCWQVLYENWVTKANLLENFEV